MGKRIEKAFGKDKGQASSSSQDNAEEDPNKTPGRLRKPNTKVIVAGHEFSFLAKYVECILGVF